MSQQIQLQKILQQELSSHPQTKKKKITKLEQLCPIWCEAIREYWNSLPQDTVFTSPGFNHIGYQLGKDRGLHIECNPFCFVGEAWKFTDLYTSDNYSCNRCRRISHIVFYPKNKSNPSIYTDYLTGKIPQDLNKDPRVQSFIQHWNENHLDIKSG